LDRRMHTIVTDAARALHGLARAQVWGRIDGYGPQTTRCRRRLPLRGPATVPDVAVQFPLPGLPFPYGNVLALVSNVVLARVERQASHFIGKVACTSHV